MAKSALRRWKKGDDVVTFVLPNSVVRPQAIYDSDTVYSEEITVHRVFEKLIRPIFGSTEIVPLKPDSTTVIDGRTHVLYEPWVAPHLPPTNRHTKYVYKTDDGATSAPLYVATPVQITIATGSNASASAGMKPALKGQSGLSRSTTLNMQVSAPVDPTISFEVVTADEHGGMPYKGPLADAISRYAADLSKEIGLYPEEIVDKIIKHYEPYLSSMGGLVSASPLKPMTIKEGETVTQPLEFTPLRSGRTLAVVYATDEEGNQVFSDFIGLNCDTETQTVTREF